MAGKEPSKRVRRLWEDLHGEMSNEVAWALIQQAMDDEVADLVATGTLTVPPPVVTWAEQELSR